MKLALACAFALLGLAGCCCGGGDCDPSTFDARCSEGGYTYCQTNRGYGIDFGNEITRVECAEDQTCIDLGMGQLACVRSPATRCDVDTFVGTCEHGVPLLCTNPNNLITEDYVITGSQCTGNTRCAVVDNFASCWPEQPPCPLPEGQTSACVDNAVVFCGEGPTGLEQTARVECGALHCVLNDVNGQPLPFCQP